jgi:hypothetical protein
MAEPELEDPFTERDVVIQRRYLEARAAGLSDEEATAFAASDVDVGLLRRLVSAHCPPATIARIVI